MNQRAIQDVGLKKIRFFRGSKLFEIKLLQENKFFSERIVFYH